MSARLAIAVDLVGAFVAGYVAGMVVTGLVIIAVYHARRSRR